MADGADGSDRRTSRPPLVLSSYTLGTQIPFEERVRIAAAAGFDGIGLRAENYVAARESGLDDDAMLRVLERSGVRTLEVEYITAWGTDQDRDAAQREKERLVLHMARTFGVRHLNVGLLEALPLEAITTAFAQLCQRCDGYEVALEFMPYSGVPDLPSAWEVVSGSGADNGALLVDAWHWTRAGMSEADLEPVPAERIVSIQLCDVGPQPMSPLRSESLHHRLPPGEGYGDVVGMVRALKAKGVDPRVIGVEVISDELLTTRGAHGAARAVLAAARDVLARAWFASGLED